MIDELWGPSQRIRLAAFLSAVDAGDLREALLAIEGAPEEEAEICRARLSLWGEWVANDVRGGGPVEQAAALKRVLAHQLDFRGDEANYYHPRNSHLARVVDRRRGLPILLSSVWILVGHEAGFLVEGVGMPGHFITRVGGVDGCLIDPFGAGRSLTEADCRRLVARVAGESVPWQEDFLEATDMIALLERVIRNLINSHHRSGALHQLYRASRFLVGLRPEATDVMMLHARVAEEVGASEEAAGIYTEVIRISGGTPHANEAAERRGRLSAQPRVIH